MGPEGAAPQWGEALSDVAKRLKVAIGRLEAERERLESLVVKLGALAASLDARGLVEGVTEAAKQLSGAPLAMFAPAERGVVDGEVVIASPGELGKPPAPAKAPLLAAALWRATSVRLDDTAQPAGPQGPHADGYGRMADGRPFRSLLAEPVRSRRGDSFGALLLAHHRPHAFGPRESQLTGALAAHLGAGLDNVLVFQERSRVARALQETLLPPVLPEVPGLEIAARYRPARSTALVGGDFYDMFETRPGTWAMLIGDVSGVGPEAAALTGIARYAARALASQDGSPVQLLAQLNATLVRFGLQDRFCTVLYGELEPVGDDLRVTLANGGHPHPFVLRAGGRAEEVEVPGMLLGALPEIQAQQREVLLAPGDTLVCFTDGVVEARSPTGAFFGTDGLARVLTNCPGRPAASIARRLELAVLEHQSGFTPDDVAIIALRRQLAG
jgi:serine phosphatase RsbU (regulator of sigma subunit)